MPELARNYGSRERCYYGEINSTRPSYGSSSPYGGTTPAFGHVVTRRKPQANHKKVEKFNLIHRVVSLAFAGVLAFGLLPHAYNKITKQIFAKSAHPEIKADYKQILFPTSNYIYNHLFMNDLTLRSAETKNPLMTPLETNAHLVGIENGIKNLAAEYPMIQPSVFVWDYNTGHFADYNASQPYSAASIIKIPVLIQLFRSIEQNQVSLYDEMTLTNYYRAEGSGGLQFKAENSKYTLDELARVMITDSDNSATNMLMSKIGSMTDVNQGIRDWGLKHTHVQTWLPDMNGTNYTTARDLAVMLYNIENPKFLSMSSREKIFDYMGHVKNNRLIAAGLGSGASILHKTGDIGKMLGDAGIVFTPSGKKYIVVILANRPYNSPAGKDFIVRASSLIYNYMAN